MDITLEVVNNRHIRFDGIDYHAINGWYFTVFIPRNCNDFSHEVITVYNAPLSSNSNIRGKKIHTSWGEIAFIEKNRCISLFSPKIQTLWGSDPMVFCTKRVGEVLSTIGKYTEFVYLDTTIDANLLKKKCREEGLDVSTYRYFSHIPKDGIITTNYVMCRPGTLTDLTSVRTIVSRILETM